MQPKHVLKPCVHPYLHVCVCVHIHICRCVPTKKGIHAQVSYSIVVVCISLPVSVSLSDCLSVCLCLFLSVSVCLYAHTCMHMCAEICYASPMLLLYLWREHGSIRSWGAICEWQHFLQKVFLVSMRSSEPWSTMPEQDPFRGQATGPQKSTEA